MEILRTTNRGALEFKYYLVGFPERAADCDPWVRQMLGKTPTKGDVRELREILAAFYGIAPRTALVNDLSSSRCGSTRKAKEARAC